MHLCPEMCVLSVSAVCVVSENGTYQSTNNLELLKLMVEMDRLSKQLRFRLII